MKKKHNYKRDQNINTEKEIEVGTPNKAAKKIKNKTKLEGTKKPFHGQYLFALEELR